MNIGSIVKYLILISFGVLGSLYKDKKKKEKYGRLIGIGKLTKPRFPLLQIYYLLCSIIINLSFIIPSYHTGDLLLSFAYSVSMVLYTVFSMIIIIRDRNKVFMFENGIEVNGNEIHKDKMQMYKEIERNKYIITRKHHKDIICVQTEKYLSEDNESREEIIKRVFPKRENKKT